MRAVLAKVVVAPSARDSCSQRDVIASRPESGPDPPVPG
jgi:hypothetical protein